VHCLSQFCTRQEQEEGRNKGKGKSKGKDKGKGKGMTEFYAISGQYFKTNVKEGSIKISLFINPNVRIFKSQSITAACFSRKTSSCPPLFRVAGNRERCLGVVARVFVTLRMMMM
jgi:hypothetical protein